MLFVFIFSVHKSIKYPCKRKDAVLFCIHVSLYRWLYYIEIFLFFNQFSVKISSTGLLYSTLPTMLISHQKYNLLTPYISMVTAFIFLATTSMCVVLDRKNFFGQAEVYGKNTRFYAYFYANVYWRIIMHWAEI